MKYYSGIGSRVTPANILANMTEHAKRLEYEGYVLRSGGATGADTAFADGCTDKVIYRPTQATTAALDLASKYHPNWKACNDYVRRLHARNAFIILGEDLDEPSEFVMCWTPEGKVVGGTGLALRICEDYGIEVINLGKM